MCKREQTFRVLLDQLLSDLFGLFERTIEQYEDKLQRQRRLLEAQPDVRNKEDVQRGHEDKVPPECVSNLNPESSSIKEEEEDVWSGLEGQEEAAVTESACLRAPARSKSEPGSEPERLKKTQRAETCPAKQRLNAAAQQILVLFERTVAEYEGHVSCLKEENERQAKLLDAVLNPQVHLHRTDVQQQEGFLSLDQDDPEPFHIKEEEEDLWTNQEREEESDITAFVFTSTPVKSENDEEMKTKSDADEDEDPDPDPDPASYLQPVSEGEASNSSETETAESDEEQTQAREQTLQRGTDVTSDPRTSLICFVCQKTFARKDSLQRHMRNHTGETPYGCSVCGRSFRQRESLVAHISCHSEERPFSCPICKKRFKLSQTVARHMKSHSGEKPFSCSVCGNTFARKENLMGHMRLHSGEKPFSCKVCRKRFRWRQNIMSHMRVHTGEKPYRCFVCSKRFKNKNYMIKHAQTH